MGSMLLFRCLLREDKKDGHMVAGPRGTLGSGIYGFQVSDADHKSDEGLAKAWRQCNFYNRGCMVVFQTDGVFIKRMKSEAAAVPPGAVTAERGQFCSCPMAVTPVNITFQVQSLVSVLGRMLNKVGYSETYHQALTVAEVMLRERRAKLGKQRPLPNKKAKVEVVPRKL